MNERHYKNENSQNLSYLHESKKPHIKSSLYKCIIVIKDCLQLTGFEFI